MTLSGKFVTYCAFDELLVGRVILGYMNGLRRATDTCNLCPSSIQ